MALQKPARTHLPGIYWQLQLGCQLFFFFLKIEWASEHSTVKRPIHKPNCLRAWKHRWQLHEFSVLSSELLMLENNSKPLVPILLRDLPGCPSAALGNGDPTVIYYLNKIIFLIKRNFDPICSSVHLKRHWLFFFTSAAAHTSFFLSWPAHAVPDKPMLHCQLSSASLQWEV